MQPLDPARRARAQHPAPTPPSLAGGITAPPGWEAGGRS